MSEIPAWLLVHTVLIESYVGESAVGPIFGAPTTVPCFVDDKRRKVRSAVGDEVISETTVYCQLDVDAPVDSRVTVNGRQALVLVSSRRDGGGLPTPDHLELALT